MAIKWTQANMKDLTSLATMALFKGETFTTKMGQQLTIYELLHSTQIRTIENMRYSLDKEIERLNNDEWNEDNVYKIANLSNQRTLLNLCIGYKKYQLEREANKIEEDKLQQELERLQKSLQTPEERIKEIEEKLSKLRQ